MLIIYHPGNHALTFVQTNMLVGADGHIRVAGFGAASSPSAVSRVDVDSFFHGAAPELIEPQRFRLINTVATTASDVYAFGVLAFEVSTGHVHLSNSQTKWRQVFAGRVPFHDKGTVAGVYSMSKGRRPSRPDHAQLTDHVWKTIKGCWKSNPTKRHTMAEVVAALEAGANAHKSR
jgi:hypothetical protein